MSHRGSRSTPGGLSGGKCFVAAGLALASSACASNPDVVITHYRPQGEVTLTAVRTVACSETDGAQRLHVATAVTATPSYARNDGDSDTIEVAALDSRIASTSLTVTLSEDGRLRGINTSSVGVGQEAIQSVIKVAGIAAGLALAHGGSTVARACGLIESLSPKEKMLTLTYALTEDFAADDGSPAVPSGPVPFALRSGFDRLEALHASLPALCALMAREAEPAPPAQRRDSHRVQNGRTNNVTDVTLRQPVPVAIEVLQHAGEGAVDCAQIPERTNGTRSGWSDIWSGRIHVPQLGSLYDIPIPTAALFGGNTFQLAVADSGAVTSIGYGLTSGAPGATASIAAAAEALQPDTTAERAAAAQAEASLIYQQQRLIRCEQSPTTCTKD